MDILDKVQGLMDKITVFVNTKYPSENDAPLRYAYYRGFVGSKVQRLVATALISEKALDAMIAEDHQWLDRMIYTMRELTPKQM